MKTLRRTLWNLRRLVLVLLTPLLLLPLPLVIRTKVSGYQQDSPPSPRPARGTVMILASFPVNSQKRGGCS